MLWFKIICLEVKVTRVDFQWLLYVVNLVGLTNTRYISEACTWVHLWGYFYKRLIAWKRVSWILADKCHVLAPGPNKMKKGREIRLSISSFLFPQRCEQTSYATTVASCSCQHAVTAIMDFIYSNSKPKCFFPAWYCFLSDM